MPSMIHKPLLFQSTPSTRRETLTMRRFPQCFPNFNPLPPHGGRRNPYRIKPASFHFNPLPPHGGRPTKKPQLLRFSYISIHSLHTEGDNVRKYDLFEVVYFNPLPPHGGRLAVHMQLTIRDLFQSTPSTRRETVPRRPSGGQQKNFNPLPPHGGRLTDHVDRIKAALFQSTPSTRRETQYSVSEDGSDGISIHSLHTEGDAECRSYLTRNSRFQSTPSTRRETLTMRRFPQCFPNFNPLPPHGGRRTKLHLKWRCMEFQSTPSTRRETNHTGRPESCPAISIHSLHTEGDGNGGGS